MPRVDFPNINDTSDFAPIPDGEYLCVLDDVEMDLTKSGDEMWKLRWSVSGGEFSGRLLFGNLVFSAKALSRVKLICECCGLDVSGEIDLQPDMLLGRSVMISTYIEEYSDAHGQAKARNGIAWDGYRIVPKDSENTPF